MIGAEQANGAQLAIFASRFERIVATMLHTLFRTARSGVINAAHDFSCCVLTAENELFASAQSLPIHVMRGPDIMARTMVERHPTLTAGDAFLHNSPYHGCSHAADHSILIPVFDPAGNHVFTVLSKAHQADCGNAEPTTYAATARDVYDEGALLFPCVQVQREYRDIADVIEMCRLRIRVPDQWWGDYLALVGAARVGERLLHELGDEVGWDAIRGHCADWLNYSEEIMRRAIAALPEGEATAETRHDPLPGIPDGIPVRVRVDVAPERGRIAVDLQDNPDCQPCGLNLSEGTALTAAMTGVFNSLRRRVPVNAGSFRRLDVLLRENCVVGIPRHPASCSAATTNLADRVTNAVHAAFAQLGDGYGMAEVGMVLPPSVGVVSGVDPRHAGSPFINQLFLLETGGGATPVADGWLTTGHAGSAGLVYRDSVEMDELTLPILVKEQRLLPDTEGAGRRRGAPGGRVEYGPLYSGLEVHFASDGTVNSAAGVRGGLPGSPADQFVRRTDGELESVPAFGSVTLQPGETIVSICCGGGGYGDPRDRERDLIRKDVEEGLVSVSRAREVYGYVSQPAPVPNAGRNAPPRPLPS
jgi:N-methylhydantoinase B